MSEPKPLVKTEMANLAKAMAKAQAMMPSVSKDAKNPYFKSRYATLSACVEAARPILAECGLSVIQFPVSVNDMIGLKTILLHESGEFMDEYMMMKNLKPGDAQYFGSAITYFRRYAFCAALGIVADDDDDGNKATPNREPISQTRGSETVEVYSATNDQKVVLAKICTQAGVSANKTMGQISAAAVDKSVKMSELEKFVAWYLSNEGNT